MARKRSRLPTLRSLARRLRTLFTARAHAEASAHVVAYFDALRDAGFPVPKEGGVPDELYQGTVTVSYARSSDNSSEVTEIPFSAWSDARPNTDANRFARCADAALMALVDWFDTTPAARFILSASWMATLYLTFDPDDFVSWSDSADLPRSGPGAGDLGWRPFGGTRFRQSPGAPARKRKSWPVTRRSTARHEKVRRRNAPGTGNFGDDLEDWT